MNYRDENGKAKVTFEIMDYILFKFDNEGSLLEIKPVTKDGYNKLTVYHPHVNLYGMSMAAVVERLDGSIMVSQLQILRVKKLWFVPTMLKLENLKFSPIILREMLQNLK